jgi:uncharacterized repeat protein (TIGR01451 family)
MSPRRFAFVLFALVSLTGALLVTAPAAMAAVPFQDIDSSGPLTHVYLGDELSCQVAHEADAELEFFPSDTIPGDCGTFLAVGDALYTPDFENHDSTATGFTDPIPFTPVSQSAVTGSGTSSDPYKVVTVVTAGAGIRITQTDSYVVGEESYRTDVKVENTGTSEADAVVYRAGDCFLAESDDGFGVVDPGTKSIGCRAADEMGNPGDRIEMWIPITGGNNYYEANYFEVWDAIDTRDPFDDTCECDELQDNGAGISWTLSIPGGQSVTRSHITTFSPTGNIPLSASKTADDPTSEPGAQNGYTITIDNPNDEAVTLTDIFDTLPAGFSYVPGSTTGVTTDDPTINGQQLTWSGPFMVPATGSVNLLFDVTVASEEGTYFNEAGATAEGFSVAPTGPTAPIEVTGEPGPPSISIGNASVTEGDSGSVNAPFNVTLSEDSPNTVTVDYATGDDTATAPEDYLQSSGTVTFAPGDTSETINVSVVGDTLDEPDETFFVNLSNPQNATISDGQGVGTIEDDDGAPGAECPGYEGDPRNQVVGTDGPDTLIGTQGPDIICGLDSEDRLAGRGEDDLILGGDGGDRIRGGHGDDTGRGGRGPDLLWGRDGNDTLKGQRGADTLRGRADDDTLRGGGGIDLIVGGHGDDTAIGAGGGDVLLGRGEDDVLRGGAGGDTLRGGSGNDFLAGGPGTDDCNPGSGTDVETGCEL